MWRFWALIGLTSAGYLGYAGLKGGGVQAAVTALREDVSQIKTSVAALDAREKMMASRIDKVEDRLSGIAAVCGQYCAAVDRVNSGAHPTGRAGSGSGSSGCKHHEVDPGYRDRADEIGTATSSRTSS